MEVRWRNVVNAAVRERSGTILESDTRMRIAIIAVVLAKSPCLDKNLSRIHSQFRASLLFFADAEEKERYAASVSYSRARLAVIAALDERRLVREDRRFAPRAMLMRNLRKPL